MINVTDHDPKIMHALGNVVDLVLRNCCNYIRCNDIAQGLSIKRTKLHVCIDATHARRKVLRALMRIDVNRIALIS